MSCQHPPMPARQIPEPESPNSDPDKTFHVISKRFEHTANLPIDSLSQHHAQTRRRDGVQPRNPCSLTIETDSAHQFWPVRGIPRPIQRDLVFLINFVTWMHKAIRKITLVCKKKQTFRLGV